MNIVKEQFINHEVNKPYICEDIRHLLNKLLNNERVIFTKFGDGEYLCMKLENIGSCNIDKDTYTLELGLKLREAFCNLCNKSDKENIYIGRWHSDDKKVSIFYCNLLYDFYITNNIELKPVPFVNYHFCLNDYNFNKNNVLFEFVKTIKNINKTKIIVSNYRNKKLSVIFNGNYYIEIPFDSWFANGYYNRLENNLTELLNINNDAIVLIAGGLASKIIISNLSDKFPKTNFIDIGSSFDILVSKTNTRDWGQGKEDFANNYKNQYEYYKDILPDNYNDI